MKTFQLSNTLEVFVLTEQWESHVRSQPYH